MTLSVLTGSIKADKLSRAISLLSSDEDEILVLCATSAQEGDIGRSFALELDYDNQNSQSNPVRVPDLQVQSFASFAADLWNKWGDGRSLVGSAIRTKVVNQTLSHSEVPAALKTSGGKVLFANIAAFFVPGNKAGLATESKKHLGIMKQHLVRYHQELENDGYIEHQFAIKLLAQTLTEEAIDFGRKKIVVVGFRDFTSAQLALLCACAKHITDSSDAEVVTENLPDRGVIITLDWEEGNPASNYTGNTLTQLLECGAQTIDVASLGSSDRYGQASQEESLEIVRGMAQGHAAEVALMADFAQEVHQEFPHEAKALLIPRPQDYLRPLAYELERRNVPFELDIKTTFGATSFGAALLALLRICVDEEAQINGLTFAMSAYSGLKPDEVLELDTRWRRYRTGPAGILAQLTKHESGACEDLRLIRARDMSAHIGDWSSLISRLYAKGLQLQSGSNFDLLQDAAAQKSTTTALQELYEEKFAHFTRQSGGGSRVVATSTPEAIITDATSLADAEQIDESADELDPIMQPGTRILSFDPRISAADLYASLREAFIAQTPNPASPAVLLAQPSRVYGRQFHSVIIGGLSAEDEIERTDSPLDVRLTASLTGSHLPDLSQQQQFNHYAVSALARKRLYLVAQTRTLAGEELKPGALWTALKQGGGATFGDSPCFEKKNDEVIAGQSFANPEKQAEIVELLQHGQTPPVLRQPSRGEELQFDLGYGEGTPVSATTLHKFANCSYNWLLHSYAAGKDIDYGFNAREQGIFAHQVLKVFYEELPKLSKQGIQNNESWRRITEANLEQAISLYQQVFARETQQLEERLQMTPDEQAELVLLRSALEAFLREEVDYAPEFIPNYFEYRFGDESNPLDLGLGLPVHGTIDRIDLRPDDGAALIIDYKRTGTIGGLQSQTDHNVFQGLLYRKAAEKVLGIRPVSHSYRAYEMGAKPNEVYTKEDNPPERPLGLPRVGTGKIWGIKEEKVLESFEAMMENARIATGKLQEGCVEKRANKMLCPYCLHEGCEYR